MVEQTVRRGSYISGAACSESGVVEAGGVSRDMWSSEGEVKGTRSE